MASNYILAPRDAEGDGPSTAQEPGSAFGTHDHRSSADGIGYATPDRKEALPSLALAPTRKRIYQPRGDASRAVASAIGRIIAGLSVTPTVRQVYYLLVTEALIRKDEKAYKALVRQLGSMRKGGVLAYDAFIDGTRERKMVQTFGAPSEALAYAAAIYRRDLWATQPVVAEVWAEADTLTQMLWQVTSPLGVTTVVTRGNSSLTMLYTSAAVIDQRRRRGQRTRIIYVGDFDPKGMDMSDNLHARLVEVGAPAHAFDVERVAVTFEQFIAYRLKRHDPKKKDALTPAFVARYGVACVEADALPPDVLAQVVEDAVMDTIQDRDAWVEQEMRLEADEAVMTYAAKKQGPSWDETAADHYRHLFGDDDDAEVR